MLPRFPKPKFLRSTRSKMEEAPVKAVPAPTLVEKVRTDEVPPPLPSSNPTSPMMLFAESTKADPLPISDQIEESRVSETVVVPEPAKDEAPVEEVKPVEAVPEDISKVKNSLKLRRSPR